MTIIKSYGNGYIEASVRGKLYIYKASLLAELFEKSKEGREDAKDKYMANLASLSKRGDTKNM